MSTIAHNVYMRWREASPGWLALRDAPPGGPPRERLLQLIWLHQRLRREALATLDGRAVTVLHPGFWNHESGPDFRQAVLQFDGEAAVSGDVEVDLRPECWREHRHAGNPAFKGVRLHVVWDSTSASELPTLALRPVLDAPLHELEAWLATEAAAASLTAFQSGRCATPLRELSASEREELLCQAARVRFERKADWFGVRARAVGWEQAFWEGLFGALGYKHNVWPMRRLAELRAELGARSRAAADPIPALQALLLGVAGFLSSEPPRRAGADSYWRRLWDVWWRERAALDAWVLPRSLWRLHGLRPANHPQRRLALAAHWLADAGRLRAVEDWLCTDPPDRELGPSLLRCLQVTADPFWSRQWTLNSRPSLEPHPLLGEARCSDLAVNVILPWFWSRASAGPNETMRRRIEHRFLAWPAGEDNVVLKLARRRLLGSASFKLPPLAVMQQGLLQIVRDFCDHANAVCEGCRFPELVKTLGCEASRNVAPAV